MCISAGISRQHRRSLLNWRYEHCLASVLGTCHLIASTKTSLRHDDHADMRKFRAPQTFGCRCGLNISCTASLRNIRDANQTRSSVRSSQAREVSRVKAETKTNLIKSEFLLVLCACSETTRIKSSPANANLRIIFCGFCQTIDLVVY